MGVKSLPSIEGTTIWVCRIATKLLSCCDTHNAYVLQLKTLKLSGPQVGALGPRGGSTALWQDPL